VKRTIAALILIPLLASCGGDTKTATLKPKTFALRSDPRADIESIDPTRGKVMTKAELHAVLDRLLSEHSALAVQLMRSVVDGSPDQTPITDALLANTAELTGAIGVVYGPDGAFAFDQLWKQHIQFFANYAAATSKAEREKAMSDLHDYQTDFSSFTTTATGGRLPLEAVVNLLHTHIDQLIRALEAYRSGDYVKAVASQHEARAHMYEISAGLAGAIADQQPIVFPTAGDNSATFVDATKINAELAQLHLDLAWSAKLRPKLMPAIEAFSASPQFAKNSADPATMASCKSLIAKGSFDEAALCSHKAFAAL
jgi:hypothetical protein